MADGVTVEVKGLAEIGNALQQIPARLATRVMREALHAAGEVMADAARASAPVASGELQGDIIVKVHVSGDLSNNYMVVGPGYDKAKLVVRKRGKYAGRPDTTSSPGVYGMFLELGHRGPGTHVRHAKGANIEFGSKTSPPRPWLSTAFNSSAEESFGVFAAYVRAGLETVVKELAK